MRLDRALTLNPWLPWLKMGHGPGLPILMYHSMREATGARHPYFETNISPAVFEKHLRFLQQEGYNTIDLSEAHELLQAGADVSRHAVITFDDAFRNFYTQAFPLLKTYGFSATLFVPSGLVCKPNSILGHEPLMSWNEIREVSDHGVCIGSHSVSHTDLYRTSSNVLEDEVRTSKKTIEEEIGEPVRSFSYPFAFPEHDEQFSRRFADVLEQVGYSSGVSTVIGRARPGHNRFILPRLPVNSYDDLALLAAKLNGDYDWLHAPQYAQKAFRAKFKIRRRTPPTLSASTS